MKARARTLGLPLRRLLTAIYLLQQIDPAELSPENSRNCAGCRRKRNAKIVIIDSLNGYLNSMPDERFLVLQMHELLSYLSQSEYSRFWFWRNTGWSVQWIRRWISAISATRL